ncbi:hypothetical protein CAC42_2724 [Sphaceloma murrayae]|uniref:DUF7918 domain-containing protein n=1 Tax=Sphaceloma murrayae TaxID=2082308 RepID=A0A2K1R0V2_9PEZI|nr:hypothetical protein CAC42_2724 [Sphaceloma murrayae]
MPCFKGLAVSIHTPEGPLPEFSIQRQSRQSRISSYIPVPAPKVPTDSTTGVPEQSSFAVSITLLVPGQRVPYSAPRPTPEDPYPNGKIVGSFPGSLGDRGKYGPVIGPYIPRTTSPNETLAAYIYFDGRPKEEVATLLRRGEETWVNSRWVSVPDSEGGGLAEREFLFREVGLERWLNGLDLVGKEKDKAAKIEKRHKKLEKRRRAKQEPMDSDEERDQKPAHDRNGVLRYGSDQHSPVESVMDDVLSSDDSDDEPPEAEAQGQIKVALFRVLASGEIKRGEYQPQFDAHDDEGEQNDGGDADIEHTTSFAKPKTLDPKTISTQTVTGIDPPDSPYAVFTFLYRSDKQLRKMGMLETTQQPETATSTKRKSTDFSKLNPLTKFGTVGFTGYREQGSRKKKDSGTNDDDAMDSDNDNEEVHEKRSRQDEDDLETTDKNGATLSPLDAHKQGELAEGMRKIKLKRAHSNDPVRDSRKSPHLTTADSPPLGTPQSGVSAVANAGSPPDISTTEPLSGLSGFTSPFKKHRASIEGLDGNVLPPLEQKTEAPTSHPASATQATQPSSSTNAPVQSTAATNVPQPDEDEEL